MHIAFAEISNFRKLLSVRVDFADETTLFVGANNSGKTSAMHALRRFLSRKAKGFETHDITLCHWPSINAIGDGWNKIPSGEKPADLTLEAWTSLLPCLDLWLQVQADEAHYVQKLIPSFDWSDGLIGVRMRLEPNDPEALFREFRQASDDAAAIKAAANAKKTNSENGQPPKLTIWPTTLVDFLDRRLNQHFTVRAYVLDPTKIAPPVKSQAQTQKLDPDTPPIEGDPLEGLIRVDDIDAQRGFSDAQKVSGSEVAAQRGNSTRLSDQLRDYWKKHLDPTEHPDPRDLEALQAIEAAQDAFDKRLTESFSVAFKEVEGLGYPRVMVVLSDEESRGFLFSYDKLFGAKEKSKTDLDNEREGRETAIQRTRRLFYVTCSRAQDSLAIVYYTDGPELARKRAVESNWFDAAEVELFDPDRHHSLDYLPAGAVG